jgi:hypothetical protein
MFTPRRSPSRVTARFRHILIALAGCWLANAAPAMAQITFVVHAPEANGYAGEPVYISVGVGSAHELTSVQAAVDGRSTALTHSGSTGTWVGALSLDGLPRGEKTLTISATNSGGQTGATQRTFIYDKLPVLTLTSPAQDSLGLPDLRVTGQCVDDGPSCSITVTAGDSATLLAVSGDTIDQIVTPPQGKTTLRVRATDSAGQAVQITRDVFVQASGKLSPLVRFPGTIVDIDATRALVLDERVSPQVLRIVDRAANSSQIIWTGAPVAPAALDETIHTGYLTPNGGALFVVYRAGAAGFPLKEWRGGALVDVATIGLTSLAVKNSWAVFFEYILPCCVQSRLVLRDLTTGTNTIVSTNAGNIHNDVAPDGRVVSWTAATPHQLFQFELPATTTPLTTGPLWNFYPRTDGVNIVFVRSASASDLRSIVLRTPGGVEEVLATDLGSFVSPPEYYQVAGGWTAFVREGTGGSRQVWVREPDGTQRQLSSTGGIAVVEAMNADGDVMFRTYGSPLSTRWLARADGTVRDLGAAVGTPRFVDGEWAIAAGPNLLAIEEDPKARSILAEGATGTFFTTDIAILNPGASAVPVTIRYLRENAPEIQETRTLPARSRTTIHANDVPGVQDASVSTHVDAPEGTNLVVERLMTWDQTGYGGHLGSAVRMPRQRWLFAEGAQGFFSTFFLIANSGAAEATVRFTFLVEQGTPVVHTLKVPPAARRTVSTGDIADLVNRSFATVIESDLPIVAERAMYFGDAPVWTGGHGSVGVTEPSMTWFHAEGATGSLFDTFILLANPTLRDAIVTLQFNTDTGLTVFRQKTVPGLSRLTVNIEDEGPELANAAVSTRVSALDVPIVSERAMYWSTTGSAWRETHNSFGVTSTGTKWGLAEGRAGGDRGYQTYVLISNSTNTPAELRVTFIREDGATLLNQPYTVGPFQRFNLNASDIPQLANSNFSTIVESINGVQISVESAIYWNVGGVIWEGGGNTNATPVP